MTFLLQIATTFCLLSYTHVLALNGLNNNGNVLSFNHFSESFKVSHILMIALAAVSLHLESVVGPALPGHYALRAVLFMAAVKYFYDSVK